jgi:hypothetical protein
LVDEGHLAAVHRLDRELVAEGEDLAVDPEDLFARGVLDGVVVPEGEPLLLHHERLMEKLNVIPDRL